MSPRVYTLDQVVEQLQVRESWLRARLEAREVPFTMLGGSYRFTDEHVEAIIRHFEQAPVTRRRSSRAASSDAGVTRLAPRSPRGPNRRSTSA